MRRLALIIGALALTVPPIAAAFTRGPGDGTLVVSNANGVVQLRVTGGIIGRFDGPGSIEVLDPVGNDGPAPVVRPCQDVAPGPKRFSCSSETEVRFRLIGGAFRVRIEAIGLDLSVVGHGTAVLDDEHGLRRAGIHFDPSVAGRGAPSVSFVGTAGIDW